MNLPVVQTIFFELIKLLGILIVNLGGVYWMIRFVLWLTDLS
jgi:hypothetical protein